MPDRQPPAPARQPIFNAPLTIVLLFALLAGIHAWRSLAVDWRLASADTVEWWSLALAFIPSRYGREFANIPGGVLANYASFLTHTLVHIDLTHLLLNSAWLFAFGSALVRRLGTPRFLAIYAVSALAGALLYLAVNGTAPAVMIGASGAISGLIGAAFRFFFRAADAAADDPEGLAGAARWVPRMTLREMAGDRRVRFAIGTWVVFNFLFALLAPWMGYDGGIAWEAHLGGFLVGLLALDGLDRIEPVPAQRIETADDGSQPQP